MEFSRQEYWSGLPFPSPRALPDPGIEPGSPPLQADSLPSEPPGVCCKSNDWCPYIKKKKSRTQKHREDHNEKEQGKNWNEHLQTKEYQRLLTSTRSYERSMGCLLSQRLQKKATLQTTWVLTSGHLYCEDSLIAQLVKYLPAMQETPIQFLGWEDPLEKD